MTDLELAYEECRSITRREARNFYYAFLTLPAAQRRAIYVTYAFCRHCDDAVDAEGSNEEKLAMLVSLRSHLSECYQGHAATPVFLALADVAGRYEIPEEYFQEVLSGVQSDLVKDRYEDFEQLRAYCYQVASVVGLICLQIFGYKDSNAKAHAIDLGLAMQLTNIARDVREDLEFGRIYLPQDEMARFGYTEEELQAGVVNDAFVNLMRFQAQRAKGYFRSGFQLLPYLSPRSRACPAVLGRLYTKILDRIESADYDVLSNRIGLSTTEKVRVTAQTWISSIMPGLSPIPK
ncbi:MAG: presqualene diphosphate synthase HpnD [Chloroflexi bacterium]|nr:presqualene diphosphate synthase HpnD [Chloroflexota bacterium]MCI0846233.1 presqualene diphosphate synthase HpnD [Chloroflexota bacterium]